MSPIGIRPTTYILIFSSTSSDSDDDLREITRKANIEFLEGLEEDEDPEDGPVGKGTGVRTKNEVNEEPGPLNIENISIDQDAAIEFLGVVEKVMDAMAIVRACTDGEYRVLDEGGVVVSDAREIVGTVPLFQYLSDDARYRRPLDLLNSRDTLSDLWAMHCRATLSRPKCHYSTSRIVPLSSSRARFGESRAVMLAIYTMKKSMMRLLCFYL
jgi:hypothetical protein